MVEQKGTEDEERNPVQEALNPNTRLVGYAGKDTLRLAFDTVLPNKDETFQFLREFRQVRSMNIPSIQPVLSLMETGGISKIKAAQDIIAYQLEAMKRQIATLDQNQLNSVLEQSYSYLTVPPLSQIAIACLERLTYVDPEMWSQIVAQGLNESPYVDLPYSIKRRIWVSEVDAFDHEVDLLLNRLNEISPPTSLEEFTDNFEKQVERDTDSILIDLMKIVQSVGEELQAQVIDKMVDRSTSEKSTLKRIALSNLAHNYVLRLSTRPNTTLGTLRKMAKFLDSSSMEAPEDQQVPRMIREALTAPTAAAPVALLVSSSYSRDRLAEKLVSQLLNRRGPVEGGEDPAILKDAGIHIRADPWIADLTFACLCNMKGGSLLEGSPPPTNEEVDIPFHVFYPLIIGEMYTDNIQLADNFHTADATLPHPNMNEMVKTGKLERRVLSTYCLQLVCHGNLTGLSRFRLVLDNIVRHSNPIEEQREAILAHHLITKVIESS